MKPNIQVKVYMVEDAWQIRFPGYEVMAGDRKMVRHLIREYAKEQNAKVHIYWVEHQ